jgi:hypothetical protein
MNVIARWCGVLVAVIARCDVLDRRSITAGLAPIGGSFLGVLLISLIGSDAGRHLAYAGRVLGVV